MATPLASAVGFDDWQWPPPKDWQKFERICHVLWRRIWNDPNAQLNGRPGQQQHGVDVYGTPKGEAGVHGVQCKRKDRLLNTLLTEQEVRSEVENAKAFHPPLIELIIATCAPSDAQLQALARQITEKHAQQGLFRVHIYGWTEILARMAEHPEVISQIYGIKPIAEPSAGPAAAHEAQARHSELVSGQVAIQQQLAELASKLVAPATDGPAHAKLDLCRELLESHSCRAALPLLERIREQEWEGANNALRFRIATNLGAAHLGSGATKEAGEYFLLAFECDHESDKALTNRAFGLFLLNRHGEALTAAREGIERHPLSPRTWGAYLNVMSRVEPESPVPDVPIELANDPHILFVRADALALRSLWGEAERLLRQLIALPKSDVMAKSRLAEVILAQVTGGRFYGGAQYSATDIQRLSEARALLEETWNAIKGTDLAAGALHVIQNWCALCAVLGQMHQAEAGVDEALAIAPESPDLIVWKIRIASLRGDGETALSLLAKLAPDAVDEYAIIEAAAYRASNNAGRAAEVLEKYIHSSKDPEISNDARCMFADVVCESDLAHAEARFNALPHSGSPQVARCTLIFARGLRDAGAADAAGRYLALAREQLATSTIVRDRLTLADALADFDDHEGAVAIYEKELSTATDTSSLREYFRCLLELDQRRRLTELLASLPPDLARKPSYEFMRANLALRSGDFAAARAALERCLALGPERLVTQLLWAEVCVRLNDPQTAKDWLATIDIRSTAWTLDQLLRLGPLHHALGWAEQATAVFYEGLRRFPHDARAHLSFCASVLFKGSDAWVPKKKAVAAADMAVRLRDSDGKEHVYILEDRPQSQLQADEISIRSDFGARLLGRTAGDSVVGHSSELATHESTVVTVEHKYVHALNTSLAAFNTRFPEAPGLVGVKMPMSGTPEERLGPLFRALKEKSARMKQIEATYDNGMPIAGLGVMLGLSSIETWRGLIGRSGQAVHVCLGSVEERDAAFDLLQGSQRRFLLDPIGLLELHQLQALEVAELVCGRLAIVQATLEELRGLIAELDLHATGYMSAFERNGEYFRHVVSAKAVAAERQMLQSLCDWASAHCEIVPAIPAQDPRPGIAERLHQVLGTAAYDTLLAAQSGNFVLLTDDQNLRRLAKGEFQLDGIWVQAVLMRAAGTHRMKRDHYNRAVSTLAGWRHQFTSINFDQLLFAASRANWKASHEFQALVSTLPLSHSEFNSHIGVVFRFLRELWRKGRGPTRSQATKLTHALLNGVDPKKSDQSSRYFSTLQHLVQRGALPQRAWLAIVDWLGRAT